MTVIEPPSHPPHGGMRAAVTVDMAVQIFASKLTSLGMCVGHLRDRPSSEPTWRTKVLARAVDDVRGR